MKPTWIETFTPCFFPSTKSLSYRADSRDSPPKAATVRIDVRTSSATPPALAYSDCDAMDAFFMDFDRSMRVMMMTGRHPQQTRAMIHPLEKPSARPHTACERFITKLPALLATAAWIFSISADKRVGISAGLDGSNQEMSLERTDARYVR